MKKMFVDSKSISMENYLRKLSRCESFSESNNDHSYVKHWSYHSDCDRTKPARMLFMTSLQRSHAKNISLDEEIDVCSSESPSIPSPFDNQRTKVLANELEYSLKSNLNNDPDSTELEDFPIENYSPQRRKMYREIMEIINSDILSKSVYNGQSNDLIKRKVVTERSAKRLRTLFANCFCDLDVIVWIHQLILDKGNLATVTSYLTILQALRVKIPTIVDKILKAYSGNLGYTYLNQLLKKHWDPCTPVLNQHKPRKLPGNAVLMMSCAGFDLIKAQNESSRFHFWTNHLNALCKVMHIPMNHKDKRTFEETIDETLLAFRNNITEFKNHYPNRPVILAGWGIGALIACLVALEAEVDAVICFGFTLTGVNGSRGGLDDPLLDNKVPTLFIIGQNSNMCSIDDIEDFRSRMKAMTGLVVVGGADDFLRISPEKMLSESITQEIVDRCILDEIGSFLESYFVKPSSSSSVVSNNPIKSCPPIREESPDIINPDEVGKRKRRRPKEYSPELISSRKRSSHSISKEITNVSARSHGSPSTSRSSRKRRHHMSKSTKSSPDKRGVGRPPGAPNKKKSSAVSKSAVDSSKEEGSLIRTFKITHPLPKIPPPPPPLEEPVREAKPAIPFALNILPKKNEPVDVEKAFGMDSIFLPRSLTPPEPEDNTVSAEETESAVGELEGSIPSPSDAAELPNITFSNAISSATAMTPEETPSMSFTTPVLQPYPAKEKLSLPPKEQPTAVVEDPIAPSGSTVKPILISTADAKKIMTVTATSSAFKTVFLHDKSLASNSTSHMKSISDSLSSKPVNPISSPSASKTMITVPYSGGTSLLVSGQTLKTPSGKIFQFLSKSPATSQSKESLSPQLITSSHVGDSVQKFVNVSSMKDMPKKLETTSSSATLVKLTAPEKPASIKQYHIVKPAHSKLETTAEMLEKQLAIKALNESVGLDASDESPVTYTKPSTSIISRVVPRPGHPSYIRQSIIAHPPNRGRVRPILPSKIYQIYPK